MTVTNSVDLGNPIFTDAEVARKHFEAIRWPNGANCPFCGQFETVRELGGKSMGPGWYHCKDCRKKFTAAVGTIYERSHIPMPKWLLATHLMCASKKGMSAHQLHRMLGLPYKTAWFMAHRIREGMRDLSPSGPLGGEGKTIEIDEANIGGRERNKHELKRHSMDGGAGKEIVFALVEREGGVRSHHIPAVTAKTLRPILVEQVEAASALYGDDGGSRVAREFPGHASVNHSIGEYVRGEVHSNTIEGHFSILKRGITGVYHHVSPQHLKRYVAEFDFRYNERTSRGISEAQRTECTVKSVVGKRVTYQRTHGRPVGTTV